MIAGTMTNEHQENPSCFRRVQQGAGENEREAVTGGRGACWIKSGERRGGTRLKKISNAIPNVVTGR